MLSRLVVIVQDDRLEKVKKAVLDEVGDTSVYTAIVINTNDEDEAAKALMVAMAAGASSAFKA